MADFFQNAKWALWPKSILFGLDCASGIKKKKFALGIQIQISIV